MNESKLLKILSSLREVWRSDVRQKTSRTTAHRPICWVTLSTVSLKQIHLLEIILHYFHSNTVTAIES